MSFEIAKCSCDKPKPYRTNFGIQALGCRKCGCFIIGRESEGY